MPMPAIGGEDDNNMTNPDVPTDLDMAAKVEVQGRQLVEQERRLQDLERRLSGMAMDMGGAKEAQIVAVEDVSPTDGNNTNRASIGRTPVDTATYEFEHSMWDAALLVFVSRSNFADMCILVTGCTLNFGLQIALLLTIFMDMIENKYEGSKVKEMLQYRVETGHASANFDTGKGQSLLQKLCGLDLWSFEQEEYQLMYDYLYKPVPGFVLSTLAIIIWVLTIMREYRRCIEQAMAVVHLPIVRNGPEIEEDGDDAMVIVGIHPVKKVLMLICLSLFRLGVMFFLGVIGCQYLAWTDGLGDIVLNAVALAFVLDVDELVAEVLLTERLRSTLSKLEPLSCGKVMKKDQKCIPLKDVIRYVITIGLIVFAVVYFLMPFYSSINAASLALCGGYQDFSYTGGTSDSAKTIIFQPSSWLGDPYLTGCDDTSYDTYLKKYYNASLGAVATNRTLIDYNQLRQKEVLNFAFGNTSNQGQKCPEGQFLSIAGEGAERKCISVPDVLRNNMGLEIQPGKDPNIPDCARFNSRMDCTVAGTMLQEIPSSGQHCLWTWFAQTCDGSPHDPHVYDQSCNANQVDPLDSTCNMWEDIFKLSNPLFNCESRVYCSNDPIYDCLGMKLYIEVELNHTNYWDPSYDDTLTQVQEKFLDGVTTAFINMANAKLKLSAITRETVVESASVLNVLVGEDLTLNKLTYAVGLLNIEYAIKPKEILSSQDFQTYLTAEITKLNLQDPMSLSNATLSEPTFSTSQELRNDNYFTTTRPAGFDDGGGYGYDGDDGGYGPDGGLDGPDGGDDGGLDGPDGGDDGGLDGPDGGDDGGLDGPDGGGPDGGLDGPDGGGTDGGLDGPDGGGPDGGDDGGLDGPDGGGP